MGRYSNPYIEGNPYLIPDNSAAKKRAVGSTAMSVLPIAKDLAPKLVKSGREMAAKWQFGDTKAGEAVSIPSPVSTEGLDAFDFSQAAGSSAGETATAVAPTAEELTSGLDAFQFGDSAGLNAEQSSQFGGMFESGEAGSGAAGAEAGASTSAASLGTVLALIKGGMMTKDWAKESSWRGNDPTSNDLKGYLANSSQHPVAASNLFNVLTPADTIMLDTGLISRDSAIGKIMDIPGKIERGVMDKIGQYCIIVTACTGRDSYEVNVTRQYRDRFMDEEELTGYYTLCIFLVPLINKHPIFKAIIKKVIVNRLVDYGEWRLEMKNSRKYRTSGIVKKAFLGLCRHIGKGVDIVLGQEA